MTTDPGLCTATTPTRRGTHQLACTQAAGHPGEHRANGIGDNLLAAWDDPGPPAIGCLLDEATDSEAFAALPECEHCNGTGKNLAGSPWEREPVEQETAETAPEPASSNPTGTAEGQDTTAGSEPPWGWLNGRLAALIEAEGHKAGIKTTLATTPVEALQNLGYSPEAAQRIADLPDTHGTLTDDPPHIWCNHHDQWCPDPGHDKPSGDTP